MPNLLEVRNLTKRFGEFVVVDDVSIDFREGEITALIGPNGAGKTTLLRLMSGELRPTRGELIWKGRDVAGLPFSKIALEGISRCFQVAHVFDSMTVMDNLKVAGKIRGIGRDVLEGKCVEYLERMGLWGERNTLAASLPHGSKRMLELGMSLIQEPAMLLSDEIAAGLSDAEIALVDDLIKDMCQSCTMVLVEHRLEFVFGICHRVVVLHNGQVIASGTPDEVKDNTRVRQVYWGE